jgi:hypothetical protein
MMNWQISGSIRPIGMRLPTRLTRSIEFLLLTPLGAGESRGGTARILTEQPLTVLYDVYLDDALVEVFAVFFRRRRQP